MTGHFKPYSGNKPFLFISYAHRDSDRVLPLLARLRAVPYRLWYDEGISPGGDWAAVLKARMSEADTVLFFPSSAFFASGNCLAEAQAAVEQKKNIFCLPLENATPGKEWAGLFDGASSLSAEELTKELLPGRLLGTEEDYDTGVIRVPVLKRILRALGLVLAILLLAASLFGIYAVRSGLIGSREAEAPLATATPTPAPTPAPVPAVPGDSVPDWLNTAVSFPDTEQEAAVWAVLGRAPEEQVRLSDLYEPEILRFFGDVIPAEDSEIQIKADGTCLYDGSAVNEGTVADLTEIGRMVNLMQLELVYQPVTDLSPLGGLTRLTKLSLARSAVSDLTSLTAELTEGTDGLAVLKELDISHTEVSDLAPLDGLPSLERVTVSRDMLSRLTWPESRQYDIVVIP